MILQKCKKKGDGKRESSRKVSGILIIANLGNQRRREKGNEFFLVVCTLSNFVRLV